MQSPEPQQTPQPEKPEPARSWRDPLAGPTPDQLAASLEAMRLRIINRRREKWFGRPSTLMPLPRIKRRRR
jgi:hypothetical protein